MNQTLELVMPNRIGDAILSLPFLQCLRNLNDEYPLFKNIALYPPAKLFRIIEALELFEVKPLNAFNKFSSWLKPPDKACMLEVSSRIIGLRAKETYGDSANPRWFANFTHAATYLDCCKAKAHLPVELFEHLRESYGFSLASIRYFGLCLSLGFTLEQIKKCFQFSPDLFSLDEKLPSKPVSDMLQGQPYLVICTEAAYNSKREEKRRWGEENFLRLSELAYEQHGLHSVLVGLYKSQLSKQTNYIHDLRGALDLVELAQLLALSKGVVCNDTGPLHLANLLGCSSFCVYLSTDPQTYGPIFPKLNHYVSQPASFEAALKPFLEFILAVTQKNSSGQNLNSRLTSNL